MIANTALPIHLPVAEVFEVFINPDIRTESWFTKSSGRLESGKGMRWDWKIYNSGTDEDVKAIAQQKDLPWYLPGQKHFLSTAPI